MKDNKYCDFCGNILNCFEDEIPINILALPFCDTLLFCCEQCLWGFINEHTEDAYIDKNGTIERE